MVVRERLYTVEDLWTLSRQAESDEQRLELSEGELVTMTPAGGKHGIITLKEELPDGAVDRPPRAVGRGW